MLAVMGRCCDCHWIFIGDPEEDLCPQCRSDEIDWDDPEEEP